MARTDLELPSGPTKQWQFKEWLNGVRTWFGGGQRFLLPGGGLGTDAKGPTPMLAIVARARLNDKTGTGYRSRMEEAKQKNMMWENDLEPIIWARLKTMFHPTNFERMRLMCSVSSNPMRRIVEDISILYESPATRFIESEKYGSEKVDNDPDPLDPATAPVIPGKAPPPPKKPKMVKPPPAPKPAVDPDPTKPAPPPMPEKPPVPEHPAAAEDAANPVADRHPITGLPTGSDSGLPQKPPIDPALANVVGTGDPDIDALAEVLDLEGGSNDAKNDTPLDKVMDLCDLDATMGLVERMTRIHEVVWVRPYVSYGTQIPAASDNTSPLTADPTAQAAAKGQPQPQTNGVMPGNQMPDAGKKPLADVSGNLEESPGLEMEGDPASGKLEYLVYDPSNADVVEDPQNPNTMLAFYYWGTEILPNGQTLTVIHFFTKDDYWKFTNDWKIIYWEENPIKRIPVAAFRKEKATPGSFYCRGVGRDLFEATIEHCLLRTMQTARFRDSAFKQLAIVDGEELDTDQVMGGPAPLLLPTGASATVLDMQPALAQMTDMIQHRDLSKAADHGIPADAYMQSSLPQSGFAKKLDHDKILKENRRIRKYFQQGEQELYEILALTLKQYPIEGIEDLDETEKMTVDFAEPSFMEEPGKQLSFDADSIKMNTTNIVEILRRDNPDLNDVELVKQAYKNKRINEALIPAEEMKLIDLLSQDPNVVGGKGSPSGGAGGAPGGKP